MEILFFRSTWGMSEIAIDDQLRKIRMGGFDGVETGAPASPGERNALRGLLQDLGLALIVQIWTAGRTVQEHAASLEAQYRRAVELTPLLVNAHTGKDYFTLEENLKLVSLARQLEQELGIPVAHEVHRGRMTFSAPATEAILRAAVDTRLTADLSHWCCVHESFLEDQAERVELAIQHTNHVHARVGHPQGPQVNDPRAPEWQAALEIHMGWWERMVNYQRRLGATHLTITPEFGPPDYMPTLPYSREPMADLWDTNVFMRDLLKERLQG